MNCKTKGRWPLNTLRIPCHSCGETAVDANEMRATHAPWEIEEILEYVFASPELAICTDCWEAE